MTCANASTPTGWASWSNKLNRQKRRIFEKAVVRTVDEMMNDGQLRRADYSDAAWAEMRGALVETVRQQMAKGDPTNG